MVDSAGRFRFQEGLFDAPGWRILSEALEDSIHVPNTLEVAGDALHEFFGHLSTLSILTSKNESNLDSVASFSEGHLVYVSIIRNGLR